MRKTRGDAELLTRMKVRRKCRLRDIENAWFPFDFESAFDRDLSYSASFAAQGNLPKVEPVMEPGMAFMPMSGTARVFRFRTH
ncbi:hypothetical protein [Sagittula stellata]|uniref:Sarcosine oxidase, beta subunit family protein n=1 Tax=Sagittula stellata (strain ATCC 700073 / DSM 11524 / E-37) TaxID=388399 RepID=A3K3C0_SAGS3|nr:hypothetical protein [Sagittula stellata]EBA08034.1 sarcosine oxidase, beta subunit family protein [Sagittula stellata E-37]